MTTTATTPVDTKTALLDAAEAVISEHGFAGASLRAITANAGTNLAAVNYHFGSKEELARAAIARYLGPVNAERLRLLDQAEKNGGELSSLVAAFVGPVIRFGQHLPDRGRHFAQLCGRAMTQPEPVLRELMIGELGDAIRRFQAAFSRALPLVPRDELLWRIQFMVGAMAHTMAGVELIDEIHDGLLDTRDVEGIVDRMVRFVGAGLAAPLSEDSE
ncbi:MAG: TetR/AcrR family transcriptional regulator [Thermoanaerobaculia bacterium]